jgi:hypothetical protein
LQGCYRLQKYLADSGYPCPVPLTPPVATGNLAVSAEAYVPGGSIVAFADTDPALFATGLAQLVTTAASMPDDLDLSPAPPWVMFDPASTVLWPPPDDLDADLNDPQYLGWIDKIAQAARKRMERYRGPLVYGHGDWWAANIPCEQGRILAVHDWDSAVRLPEPIVVGGAASIFPGTGQPGEVASVAQSELFIRTYVRERGRTWSVDDEQVCWAASVWTRAFDAKKESMRDQGEVRALVPAEAAERLGRAGVSID